MATIRKYKPGEFCWTDLGTTDVAGAKKFYKGIFGWESRDGPMGIGDLQYSMLLIDGKEVCALYPMYDAQCQMKIPPFWLPYISVKSVVRTVKKAKAAGSAIVMEPIDVMKKGRMAVIQDPSGAVFALWQAWSHPGAKLDDMHGTVYWQDLNTVKRDAAAAFYTTVFGWQLQNSDFSGNAYHLFKLNGEAVAGMWPEAMDKLPPSWLTYWEVSSCAKTVAKAKRLGGTILMGTTLVPGMCKFAVLKDPQGAVFGILEPD